MMLFEYFLWTSFFLIVYCYFGYPVILTFVSWAFEKPVRKAAFEPTVSIMMSVFNEEDVIAKKLENILSLEYPPGNMEILIGSDGSTDKTVALIKRSRDVRVRIFDNGDRRGKPVVLNQLVSQARHDVLIFTDARQILDKNAVRELVANFADSEVGCVSGELVFGNEEGGTGKGINVYWRYEKFLRAKESKIHSMLGATGAIYAVRRNLFAEIPPDVVLDDMFVPFKAIQKGYRAVFDSGAKAYDKVADKPEEEYRRKIRTLSGNYQILKLFPGMMNPFQSPVAIQLFSHKLLRLLAPFLMLLGFFINMILIGNHVVYQILFGLQLLFYWMAFLGCLARDCKYGILKAIARMCYIPYVFCLLNFSALAGFIRFVTSGQEITWQKAREQ